MAKEKREPIMSCDVFDDVAELIGLSDDDKRHAASLTVHLDPEGAVSYELTRLASKPQE